MYGLQDAVLMWAELLQFLLEQLRLLVGDCLPVEDENVADVVVMNLCGL